MVWPLGYHPSSSRKLLIDGHVVWLTRSQMTIFATLFNARGGVVRMQELVNALWNDRDDGGPVDTQSCIGKFIFDMRRALRPTCFRVVAYKQFGWRMTRLPAADLNKTGASDHLDCAA